MGVMQFGKNFSMEQFSNTTNVLNPGNNDLYVAAEECRRFVIENCYAATKAYMYAAIGLAILLFLALLKFGVFNKEIDKVKRIWKKIRKTEGRPPTTEN